MAAEPDDSAENTGPAEISLPEALRKLVGRGQPQPLLLTGPTFTNYREAEEWARENIRGLAYVDYAGADIDVVNALNRVVKAVSDRYQVDMPGIAPHSWEGWLERSEAFMAANREGIRYNPEMAIGLEKEQFLAGWAWSSHSSAAGKDLEALVAHEMAHVLEANGRLRSGHALPGADSTHIVRKHATAFRENAGRELVEAELSAYAWAGSGTVAAPSPDAWRETWAMAFSAYIRDPATLSPEAVTMVEAVLRDLRLV